MNSSLVGGREKQQRSSLVGAVGREGRNSWGNCESPGDYGRGWLTGVGRAEGRLSHPKPRPALRVWAFYRSSEDAVWRWPCGEMLRVLCRSQRIAGHRQMEPAEGSPTAKLCRNLVTKQGQASSGRLSKASTYSVKSNLARRAKWLILPTGVSSEWHEGFCASTINHLDWWDALDQGEENRLCLTPQWPNVSDRNSLREQGFIFTSGFKGWHP